MTALRAALALFALAAATSAQAATYYLSDCQTGAHAACVPGSASNDGLSPSTPKQSWSQLPPRQGGDRILFARGGAWTDASMSIHVPTASAAHPVMWDAYAPPWGGTAKPILTEARAGRYLFNFDDGGQKAADGGYVIRNLDLRGGGVMGVSVGGQAGVFMYWRVDDLLIEGVEISGFKYGVYSAHNPKAANGWENYRLTLRNSHLHDNSAASFLGGAADLLIENNRLDRNGAEPILDHDLYISSATRGVIRGNTITRSVLNGSGKCAGSVIVVHGAVDGLLIEGNQIVQPQASAPHCYGIEISGGYADAQGSEYFHDVIIRGNAVVNVGYVGIGLRSCTRCIVEHNRIVWTGTGGNQGISMSVNTPSPADEPGTALVIRNNSIYNHSPAGTSHGVLLVNEGTGHTVTRNLIYFGPGADATSRCHDVKTYVAADFASFDHNLCFRAGGPVVYSASHTTWSAGQAAGFDVHGWNLDPLFAAVPDAANGYSLALQPASPAAGVGAQTALDRVPPARPQRAAIRIH